MTTPTTDTDLLRQMRGGAADAFAALYRRHQGPLYRFALLRCGSADTAADVVQETFMGLLTDRFRFDPLRGQLQHFLFGVARNLILKNETAHQRHVVLGDDDDGEDDLPDDAACPLARLLDNEAAEEVRRALDLADEAYVLERGAIALSGPPAAILKDPRLRQLYIGEIEAFTITASGGPFRTWPRERMETATPEQALKHPTWSTGAKITIDSASLMNKGLELIEAHHLFGIPPERLKVLVHPQSLVHALVTFRDGSIHAEMGAADMRRPIGHCLYWPERAPAALAAAIGALLADRGALAARGAAARAWMRANRDLDASAAGYALGLADCA